MPKDVKLNPVAVLPTPNREQLQALARLSHNPDFATLFDYWNNCLMEQDRKNRVTREDTPLRQGQGISQALEFMIQTALTAQENLQKVS